LLLNCNSIYKCLREAIASYTKSFFFSTPGARTTPRPPPAHRPPAHALPDAAAANPTWPRSPICPDKYFTLDHRSSRLLALSLSMHSASRIENPVLPRSFCFFFFVCLLVCFVVFSFIPSSPPAPFLFAHSLSLSLSLYFLFVSSTLPVGSWLPPLSTSRSSRALITQRRKRSLLSLDQRASVSAIETNRRLIKRPSVALANYTLIIIYCLVCAIRRRSNNKALVSLRQPTNPPPPPSRIPSHRAFSLLSFAFSALVFN
jgi:hypothetical protein